MKSEYLIVGIKFGILSIGGVLSAGFLIGSEVIGLLLAMSLMMGIMTTGMIYFISKYMDRKVHKSVCRLTAEVKQDDKILVDGLAGHNFQKNGLGKLFLTKRQLLFKTVKTKNQLSYRLDDISDIRLCKVWGLFSRGLKFYYHGNEEQYCVDYPRDWKLLIEYVQEFNRN